MFTDILIRLGKEQYLEVLVNEEL